MQLEESKEASEKKMKKERRTFLKRAVYTAPSLMVLGSLTKSAEAGNGQGSCQGFGCQDPPDSP